MTFRGRLFASVAVVGVALMLATTAQAASVLSLLEVGPNVLRDLNAEALQNNVGSADVIDVGDVIYGVIDFARVINNTHPSPGAGIGTVSLGGNDELTAYFRIKVLSKDAVAPLPGGPPRFAFTFGPDDTGVDPNFGVNGTMVRVFTGAANMVIDGPGVTRGASIASATDGSLFWELGFTGAAGEGWLAEGPDTISVFPVGSLLGGIANFGVNRTTAAGLGGGLALVPVTTIFGTAEFNGSGSITGISGGPVTPWQLTSHTDVNFNLIPLPPAVYSGLGMLGVLGAVYLRRRMAA